MKAKGCDDQEGQDEEADCLGELVLLLELRAPAFLATGSPLIFFQVFKMKFHGFFTFFNEKIKFFRGF